MTERLLRNLGERRLYYPNPTIWRRLRVRWWPALLMFLFLVAVIAPRVQPPPAPLPRAAR